MTRSAEEHSQRGCKKQPNPCPQKKYVGPLFGAKVDEDEKIANINARLGNHLKNSLEMTEFEKK